MNNPKKWYLISLAIVAFIQGAFSQYMYQARIGNPDPFGIIFLIIGAAFIYFWYATDAEQIGYKRGYVLNICVIALTIVGLPYYFFRSRGLKKGLIYSAVFVVFILLWFVFEFAGALTVNYMLPG
ncbi:MAG: hypothetical protein GC149_16330 [Gammaproteobacteria bacterium]|nr:hypothetical protein [Gammaproteobacteria bacterium]